MAWFDPQDTLTGLTPDLFAAISPPARNRGIWSCRPPGEGARNEAVFGSFVDDHRLVRAREVENGNIISRFVFAAGESRRPLTLGAVILKINDNIGPWLLGKFV
jgi:hypothetical protein